MLGLNFGKQFSKPEKPDPKFSGYPNAHAYSVVEWGSGCGKGRAGEGRDAEIPSGVGSVFLRSVGCGMAMRVGVESLLDDDFFFFFFFYTWPTKFT